MQVFPQKLFSRRPSIVSSQFISRVAAAQLPRLASWLLAIATVLFIAQQSRYLPRNPPSAPLAPSPATSTNAIAAVPALDIATINTLHLFGKKPVVVAPDIAALPASSMNLKLAGIFMSTHSAASRSLISVDGQPAASFTTGATLPGGATLYRIEHDYVIVQRDEQLEKLTLHTPSVIARPAIAQVATPTGAPFAQQTASLSMPPGVATARIDNPGAAAKSRAVALPPAPMATNAATQQLQTLRQQMDARIAALHPHKKS